MAQSSFENFAAFLSITIDKYTAKKLVFDIEIIKGSMNIYAYIFVRFYSFESFLADSNSRQSGASSDFAKLKT